MGRYFCFTLTLIGLVLLGTAPVNATPFKAVIYPSSAKVWERSQQAVKTDSRGPYIELELPRSVDPTSLVTQLSHASIQISNISWQETTATPSAEVQKLKTKLEEAIAQKGPIEARVQALNARQLFWNSHAKFQTQDYTKIKQLADTIAIEIEQTQTLLIEQAKLGKELQETITHLEMQLQQMIVNAEKTWSVRLSLAHASDKTPQLDAEYSYTLNGCGWKSNYRIEGVPEKQHVLFHWESTLWQRSGQNWKDVEISIATIQPRPSLTPPVMPEWVVRAQPKVQPVMAYRSKGMMMDSAPAMAASMEVSGMAKENSLERMGAFSIWHLGHHTLVTGEESTLLVQQEQWPATFRHLLRPALSNTSFIEAEVEFAENKDIPSGSSIMLLSGAVIGKSRFSLNDNKTTLYFGEDPFVVAETKTLERASGKRGILGGQQSLVLAFETTVRNTQPYPIAVRLEEAKPAIESEQVQLNTTFKPQPTTKVDGESVIVWEFPLAAQKEKVIDASFEFKAPKDMNIDWGWR